MATFRPTFHPDNKISSAWWGGGVYAHPFRFIYHQEQSCGVQYTPAERADTLPLFLLYPNIYSVMETINDLPWGWGGGEGSCLVYKFHLRGAQRSLQFKEGEIQYGQIFFLC